MKLLKNLSYFSF